MAAEGSSGAGILFEPDERPPAPLALGLGLQFALLSLSGMMLIPMIVFRAVDDAIEREVSLRLLRHVASSVRHQQYHDTDILTVRVEAPGPGGPF